MKAFAHEGNAAAIQHLSSVLGVVQAAEYTVIEAFRAGVGAGSVQAALGIFDAFRKILCILRYGNEAAMWGEELFEDMAYAYDLYHSLSESIREGLAKVSEEVIVREELHGWNVMHQVHPPNLREAAEDQREI